jgi:hypothetical protein
MKKANKPHPGRGGPPTPKFEATFEQRAMVAAMSAFMVDQDTICKLLINPYSGKRISKMTLHREFKSELETGAARLKELISRKYLEAVERGESWAIKLGLRNKYRWAISDGPLPPELPADDAGIGLNISFVMPSGGKDAGAETLGSPPIDVRPAAATGQPAYPSDAQPDYSRPALEPPRGRSVDPGYGLGPWRTDRDPNSWMK